MKRIVLFCITWLAAAGAQAVTPWPAQCIQTIAVAQTINGRLASSDCSYVDDSDDRYFVDVYAFSGTQGQQIAISMTSDIVDAFLELHTTDDKTGIALTLNDDSGVTTDARIPADLGYFTLPATGTYYIWATSAFSEETGAYTIAVTEPGGTPWASRCIQSIAIGETVTGTLDANDCFWSFAGLSGRYYTDVYAFDGTQGQQIALALDSRDFNAWLELHSINDLEANPLALGDDEVGTNERIPNSAGFFTLPATGTYYIWATTTQSREVGAYSLRLTEGKAITVTEFYHPEFDHYFITAYPEEAASLAAGNLPPWVPTGRTFEVWSGNGTFVDNVWRFFSASFAPLSGHFYTNNPIEAGDLQRGSVWTLEANDAFYMMASPSGTCASNSRPLYRLYNNGQGGAPNHRYTVDSEVRDQMIAANWIPEGNGPDGVFTCVPLEGASAPAGVRRTADGDKASAPSIPSLRKRASRNR